MIRTLKSKLCSTLGAVVALLVGSGVSGCKGDAPMPVMLAPGNRAKVEKRGLALAVVENPRDQRLEITLTNVGSEPVVVFTESGRFFSFIRDGVFILQHAPTYPYEGRACTLSRLTGCGSRYLHYEGRLHPGDRLTLTAELGGIEAREPAETLAAESIKRYLVPQTRRVEVDRVLVRVFAPRFQDVISRSVYYGKPLTPKTEVSVDVGNPDLTAIEATLPLANPITVTHYEPIELPKKK